MCWFSSGTITQALTIGGSLRTYGAVVDELKAPFGGTVPLSEIEAALKSKKYKLITFTHVDTSTGW